jgi:hypothetical protein
MRISTSEFVLGFKAWRFALAFAALAASAGAVAAKDHPAPKQPAKPAAASQDRDLQPKPSHPLNPEEADEARFHDSGTRGREELGADPHNPEGPGNQVNE